MHDSVDLSPIVIELDLELSAAAAFDRFTAGFADWWPVSSHSLSRTDTTRCLLEARTGGRLYEIAPDGTEHVWGHVVALDPGSRIRFTWHPDREAASAQWVEVSFDAAAAGRCHARLRHGGWEALGEIAPILRNQYGPGWQHVFGRLFRAYAERRH